MVRRGTVVGPNKATNEKVESNESIDNVMDCSDLEDNSVCALPPTKEDASEASVTKPELPDGVHAIVEELNETLGVGPEVNLKEAEAVVQSIKEPGARLKVYVVGGGMVEAHLFVRNGFAMTMDYEKADVMVFTGGADINPLLYGERPIPGVDSNPRRDTQELRFFRNAPKNCFKVGICRGGQLLNVLNGGRLWQDVDNHGQNHTVTDVFTGRTRSVSSTHHQQFIPAYDADVVAFTKLSSRKQNENVDWKLPMNPPMKGTREYEYSMDYEVLWYKGSRSLCFQPHPEYAQPADTERYFLEVLHRYL